MNDPLGIASVEPDSGNLLVWIWEALGRETDPDYSTNDLFPITQP